MEELNIITTYIASWMWHLIGVMFLIGFIFMLVIDKFVFMLGLAGVTLFCEVMAWKKQKEVYKLQNENL